MERVLVTEEEVGLVVAPAPPPPAAAALVVTVSSIIPVEVIMAPAISMPPFILEAENLLLEPLEILVFEPSKADLEGDRIDLEMEAPIDLEGDAPIDLEGEALSPPPMDFEGEEPPPWEGFRWICLDPIDLLGEEPSLFTF